MAITKIHAVKVRLGDAINYIENPDKTDGQELISGYNTAPQTAVLDFSITAAMARKARNASAKKQGNLAYHLIQSFSPDDAVTPEQAHELGRKLAMEFTDGKFEFVVATHINKDSIHNHIIINAVSFYDYKKLRTVPYRTAQQIRSISDRLCMESQLSVIKDPQQLGQLYPTYIQKKRTTSNRTEVRKKLNFCLERATNYAQFLQMVHKTARVCHLHGLFPPFRRRFSATLSGLLATQTIFLNNERGTSKNAVTTFKEVHRNDGLQENSYASKYGVQPTRNGTQ